MNSGGRPRAPTYSDDPCAELPGLSTEKSPVPPEMAPNTSPSPSMRAMICSIGPPGTNCVRVKLMTMIPNRVGMISSNLRRI